MKVLELLDEIEEIVDTSTSFPLTGKIMVDAEDILEIVKEIRVELPDEIQQAQWIKDERQKILEEAKQEYDKVVTDAKRQAEVMVESSDIVVKAKLRADEIIKVAEEKCKQLKLNTFDYVDSILFNLQEKMDQMNAVYFTEMIQKLESSYQGVSQTLVANRNEIKELAYNTQMEKE